MIKYICYDPSNNINDGVGEGSTLLEAYKNYADSFSVPDNPEDLVFYEVTEIVVEFKIVKKEVVTKVTPAKVSSKCP